MSDIESLRQAWATVRDGETGHAFGEALEHVGHIAEAAVVYEEMAESGYLIGLSDLAWLERERGNHSRAQQHLERYLELDDDPDDSTAAVAGVLGHWRWHFENRTDAEPLLRTGAAFYPSARVDLAHLLRATARDGEAEVILRAGVAATESESFLPLANLLCESGRIDEAEQLYRYGYALGDAHSAYNLHSLLIEQDRTDEAADWPWLAAEGGDEKAITWLADRES